MRHIHRQTYTVNRKERKRHMFRKTEQTSTGNRRKKERQTYLHSMTDRGRKRHKIREVIQIEKYIEMELVKLQILQVIL